MPFSTQHIVIQFMLACTARLLTVCIKEYILLAIYGRHASTVQTSGYRPWCTYLVGQVFRIVRLSRYVGFTSHVIALFVFVPILCLLKLAILQSSLKYLQW